MVVQQHAMHKVSRSARQTTRSQAAHSGSNSTPWRRPGNSSKRAMAPQPSQAAATKKTQKNKKVSFSSAPESPVPADEALWESRANVFEYTSAANPHLNPIPVLTHPPALHEEGPTRVIPFDISSYLDVPYPCTGPNLMASFVRIQTGESLSTDALATSQAFYVIRGSGSAETEDGVVSWSEGDLFVVPAANGPIMHHASGGAFGGAALYWVNDEPLMRYLGVRPCERKFEPTLYTKKRLLQEVANIASDPAATNLNRLGVLLGNEACPHTKTLTHVLWSLLNSIGPHQIQRPHRHNSIALDYAVSAQPGVYTLMGQTLDENGEIIDPIRCDWTPGGVFVTPPGWWHAHYNESDEIAWVLPMQDAGMYTHQRTLDIRFVDDEVNNQKNGLIRGAAFEVTNKQYTQICCNVDESLRSELVPTAAQTEDWEH